MELKRVSKDGGANVSMAEFKAFIREGVKSNARLKAELENEDAVRAYTGKD